MFSATDQAIADRAKQLYEQKLRRALEKSHQGSLVAIEPDSGDYFLGQTVVEVMKAAQTAHPGRMAHIVRIGSPAVYEIGASS